MPRVTWKIDADDRPLRRKLKKIDKLADKTSSKLSGMGAMGGRAGGGGGGKVSRGGGGIMSGMMGARLGSSIGGGALSGGAMAAGGIAAIGIAAGASVVGLAKLGGELETTKIQFNTMLQSAEKGQKMLDQLNEFANFTPFSNQKVQQSGRTLLAFGMEAKNVLPTMKMLGDVSAGTGKDLRELSVIYGQIRGANRLMGGDLLQLINAGFNPLEIISKKTGKTQAELKKEMGKGLISFEMVKDAFKTATSEGGMFNNMTIKLANSFEGKVSTALGKGRFLLSKIGEKILPALKKALDLVILGIDKLLSLDLSPLKRVFQDVYKSAKFLLDPIMDVFNSLKDSLGTAVTDLNAFQIIVDSIALSWRAMTFPIKTVLTGIKTLIDSGGHLSKIFTGISKTMYHLSTGNFSMAAQSFKLTKQQAGQAADVFKTGFGKFIDAEASELSFLLKNFGKDRGKKQVDMSTDSNSTATSPVTPNTTSSSRRSSGSSAISGSGGRNNFTINMDNTIVFDRSEQYTDQELQAYVTRALANAVNDVQRMQ